MGKTEVQVTSMPLAPTPRSNIDGREIVLWFRGAAVSDLVRGLASFPRTFLRGRGHRSFHSSALFPLRRLHPAALWCPWGCGRMMSFPLAATTRMQETRMQRTHIEKWAWLLADLVHSPNPSQ